MFDLPLCLGEAPSKATQMTTFMIINQPSTYNIIIERPAFNAFHVIPSAYHMTMKFSTVEGVWVVKRDQTDTRKYYAIIVKNSCRQIR